MVQVNRLKELRLKHGYKTQQQLASVLFVNQTAVSQWERGVTVPSSTLLVKLSQMYGVSIDYILGNDDSEKEKPATVSGDGQADKLAQALHGIGIEVDKLSDAEISRIARLAKAALEE